MAMAIATKDMNDGHRNYLMNSETQIAYEIISEDPIGRASGNIPVYKVAYSNGGIFVSHELLCVKKVNYRDSNSILPFSKLYKEVLTRNGALRYHKKLMPVEAHFIDEETEDLCVVMPYAGGGSLRSIMADTFPYGFPEECICVALRSVLKALCFLHDAKIVHRDVNAGHVYVKGGPRIMLGFAATVYEHGNFNVECSSHSALAATMISNWGAAPEVYNGDEYSEKADIWLVGITALELAYGGIRVPNREALEMLIMEIVETKKLPKKYQLEERKEETRTKEEDGKGKKIMEKTSSESEGRSFSREFEKMVAACVVWNPEDRPTARTLLNHDFFSNNGLMLKSQFQKVVITKMEDTKSFPPAPVPVPMGKKRSPKSYISIPGADEALNHSFITEALNYSFIDEVAVKRSKRSKRSKRVKRKLFQGREDSAKAENEVKDEDSCGSSGWKDEDAQVVDDINDIINMAFGSP